MWILYDLFFFLGFLGFLPKILWDRWIKKKQGPTLSERLGLCIPQTEGKQVLWIHAVSVGEMKAAQPLFLRLKEEFPQAFFLITCTTKTGWQEAKRSLPLADACTFLPLDLSWIMRRWIKRLRPTHFFLMEGDFWYNQLRLFKKQGTKRILVSGKISQASKKRFHYFPFFARRLFGLFDLFCVQSEEMAERFAPFVSKPLVTGNIKLDIRPQSVSSSMSALDRFSKEKITIASTHAKEEEALLEALAPFVSEFTLFLAPRHPERLEEVKKLLKQKELSTICWSEIDKATGGENVILIDIMGQLSHCYARSLCTLVGGSFVPHIGGHNLLEPCLYGSPSLFGPYVYAQRALSEHVIKAEAGRELPLEQLSSILEDLFRDRAKLVSMQKAAQILAQEKGEVTERTLFFLKEKNIWK